MAASISQMAYSTKPDGVVLFSDQVPVSLIWRVAFHMCDGYARIAVNRLGLNEVLATLSPAELIVLNATPGSAAAAGAFVPKSMVRYTLHSRHTAARPTSRGRPRHTPRAAQLAPPHQPP